MNFSNIVHSTYTAAAVTGGFVGANTIAFNRTSNYCVLAASAASALIAPVGWAKIASVATLVTSIYNAVRGFDEPAARSADYKKLIEGIATPVFLAASVASIVFALGTGNIYYTPVV